MRPLRIGRLACVVALAVGCGGATRSPPAPSRPQPVSVGPPRPAPVRIGTSGDYPPMSVVSGDGFDGFAPALVGHYFAERQTPFVWTRFRWPDLMADFRADRFDVVADGITVRPERSIAGRFTVPIATGGAVLLLHRPSWAVAKMPAGASPAKAALGAARAVDSAALRVVVNEGGHLERFTRAFFQRASVRAIADNAAVREAFVRGEADAAMTNTYEAPRWAEGLAVDVVGPLSRDTTAFWLPASRADLEESLDDWLLAEEESGRLDAHRHGAIGAGAGPKTATPSRALFAAMAERLALMPFVAADKHRTGKPIEDREQEVKVLAAAQDAVDRAAAKRNVPALATVHVSAFFRAQIEAAKRIQEKTIAAPPASTYSLQDDLRPAIARIDARVAFLIARLPRTAPTAEALRETLEEARAALAPSGLDDASITTLGKAVASLGAP